MDFVIINNKYSDYILAIVVISYNFGIAMAIINYNSQVASQVGSSFIVKDNSNLDLNTNSCQGIVKSFIEVGIIVSMVNFYYISYFSYIAFYFFFSIKILVIIYYNKILKIILLFFISI